MGKQNLAVNRLLERKEIFADLINGTIFQGRQMLHADQLELLSTQSGVMKETEGGRIAALERRGDIRMRASAGTYSLILANETQERVHYAMPVRNMLYDALEYTRQVQELEKKHRREETNLKKSSFLSGITPEDRLCPVITTVLYLGEDWDGSRSLHEMLDFGGADEDSRMLSPYLPDYRINLISAQDIGSTENFRTCLQHIFCMIKYNKDKKKLYEYMQIHKAELQKMDDVETMAAFVLLGEQKRIEGLLRDHPKEEGTDMCKAIDDLIKDGEMRGKLEGKIEGENRALSLINALIADGRQNLIAQMTQDPAMREELYQQYQV